MKNVFFIAICIIFFACKKEANTSAANSNSPTIKSVTIFKAFSGSQEDVGFNVDIVADSSMVDYVELYRVPYAFCWRVDKPTTGHYTMYDRASDYQVGDKYYFVFGMHDGTMKNSDTYTAP